MKKNTYCWLRRDLRVEDNLTLFEALSNHSSVQCLFIFDENIIHELPKDDHRITFIHQQLCVLSEKLALHGSSLRIEIGDPATIWKTILSEESVDAIYSSKDYEPYARIRDGKIAQLAKEYNTAFHRVKDQVIFDERDVLKGDGTPYTVFTPYKRKWLEHFHKHSIQPVSIKDVAHHLSKSQFELPTLSAIGFKQSAIQVAPYQFRYLSNYDETRDFPALDTTSYLSPHLRFGTIGIRQLIQEAGSMNETFLSELIWREFFMQILYHFPDVVQHNFKRKYDAIPWRNNKEEFDKWCKGETGYPLVDAGMRQLNQTGYMHNRVRMITAGFLCKHLLIDWRWGEAYFAKKLLDYDLSANNGNWQWAAGTGCDAAPYFRVFNPTAQLKKFDPDMKYVRLWVHDIDELSYPQPIVEHAFARKRAIDTYKQALTFGNATQ